MNEGFLRTRISSRNSSVSLVSCIVVLQMLVGCYAESFTEINEINRTSLKREHHMKPNAVMMFR